MGAGASAGGDGQLLPPTKNPAAIPIFSGLEELQAKLVEKGSWTEGDRDEIGELLAAARVFYDIQIEGAKRVQAQLEATRALLTEYESHCKQAPATSESISWTVAGSLFFAFQVMTTIGYGTFAPAYAACGVPSRRRRRMHWGEQVRRAS